MSCCWGWLGVPAVIRLLRPQGSSHRNDVISRNSDEAQHAEQRALLWQSRRSRKRQASVAVVGSLFGLSSRQLLARVESVGKGVSYPYRSDSSTGPWEYGLFTGLSLVLSCQHWWRWP